MAGENHTRITECVFTGFEYHPHVQGFLFLLFLFLPCCHDRKPGHDFPHPGGFPPAHTDVLFSQSPVLGGCLPFVRGWPQDAQRLLRWKESHFFPRPRLAPVVLWALWGHRVPSPGTHGLWPPCGHLQPIAVCSCYVPQTLHTAGGWTLRCWISEHHDPHNSCFPTSLLWFQHYQSLLLWHVPASVSDMCWHTDQYITSFHRGWSCTCRQHLTILISYFRILISILSIHSARGRHRAFSTCSSHLTAVSILYETLVFIYMRPGAVFSLDLNKVVAVFYTAVIPMLNPLIYSLRNKEVKAAMRRTFARRKFCLKS